MKPSQFINLAAEIQEMNDAEEAYRYQMQYASEIEELDIVPCEIQEAIQSGDWDRARQLASLIDINIQ